MAGHELVLSLEAARAAFTEFVESMSPDGSSGMGFRYDTWQLFLVCPNEEHILGLECPAGLVITIDEGDMSAPFVVLLGPYQLGRSSSVETAFEYLVALETMARNTSRHIHMAGFPHHQDCSLTT